MFILQIANYVIPLIIIPYLGNVLGAENFGKIVFAQAFVGYFLLFTDFGFNVSATKDIADCLGDKHKISEFFWNTFIAKGLLMFISLLFFVVILLFFDRFKEDKILFLISFINVFSSLLFPVWLFQGMEKMKLITIINTLPKILMIFFIFYFVKDASDYRIALLIQVLVNLSSAILSLFFVFFQKLVYLNTPTVKGVYNQIIKSSHIFLSSLSSNLYTTTNTVILGLVINNNAVGIYSAADKLVRAIVGLLSSITQVIFPRINIYYHESKQKCVNFIKKIIIIVAVISVILGLGIYSFSEFIMKIMFKNGDFTQSAAVLRYCSALPFFAVINGLIAVNIFITFGLKKELLKIVFMGCIFSLILIYPLVFFFKEIGPAICSTITEIFIMILFLKVIKTKNVFYEKK
ncbi:teichoic acid transporter [Cloacibacterium rupense]|uniref:Teichoic acid transporter n=1 Tax=Cloacibacterium rupense TaxID=517423 RepID=A0ABQ2NLN7_9FLAO|nr:teichoic acid transporter [Cloacibacterium rupense]